MRALLCLPGSGLMTDAVRMPPVGVSATEWPPIPPAGGPARLDGESWPSHATGGYIREPLAVTPPEGVLGALAV